MEHPTQQVSALLAAVVGFPLAAWILFRGARSTPTRLLALLVGCLALLQGFEFLGLKHHQREYIHLEYIGVVLAPCIIFHYAMSLAGQTALRRWAVASAYAFGLVFLTVAVGGLWNERLRQLFWDDGYHYNSAYIAVFLPFIVWSWIELTRGLLRAPDRQTRSLFVYPLAAGLVAVPTGFLELSSDLGWHPVRLASLGCLVASVILAVGVVRHRAVYDAFAMLRRDAASVLRATVQGVLYVEPDGRVLFSNGVARTLLGLDRDPRTLAEAGLEVPSEGRGMVRRGDRILELRVAPSTEVFPPGRFSLVIQDKTRDVELLQRFASREALAAMGEAAATLAHEIRNPLTVLKSSLDCAAQDLAEGRTPERRHLELALGEADRLQVILERSLQLSRPLELRREPCDVGALISRMIDRLPPAESARVARELDPALPVVHADPDLLAQLFANLLQNAVEASRQVRVSARRIGERLAVDVFSAEARIPDHVLPRLFEPFVTTKARGNGLGLALCRKIAAAHGASVDGRNVEGGVTFEVSFPL